MSRLTTSVCAALIAAVLPAAAPVIDAQHALPAALDAFLSDPVHATPADRTALIAGEPVVELLDVTDPAKEVAVFGAIWVNASPSQYVAEVTDIERFEQGAA